MQTRYYYVSAEDMDTRFFLIVQGSKRLLYYAIPEAHIQTIRPPPSCWYTLVVLNLASMKLSGVLGIGLIMRLIA